MGFVLEVDGTRANCQHFLIMALYFFYELVSMREFIYLCLNTLDEHILRKRCGPEPLAFERLNRMLDHGELLTAA